MPIYLSQNTVLRKKAKTDPNNSRKAGRNTNVISFLNLKGGVGKTILCLTIGEILSFGFNKKVLLIDLDSQSNLSSAIVTKDVLDDYRKEKNSIYHLFLRLLNPNRYSQDWNLQNAIATSYSNIKDNLVTRKAQVIKNRLL